MIPSPKNRRSSDTCRTTLPVSSSTLRNVGAVAVIDVAQDGAWTLQTRFGRTLAVIPPDTERRLEMTCSEVWLVAGAVPRRQAVVTGRVHLVDGRRLKLAESGPYAYDNALAELGYDASAPRPGERVVV